MAGGGGLEPPVPGPEPGVLPLDDPPARRPLYVPMFPGVKAAGGVARPACQVEGAGRGRGGPDGLENGGLQRAARLETRHFFRWNANRVTRPRIPAVPLGAPADHEGPEAPDGDA